MAFSISIANGYSYIACNIYIYIFTITLLTVIHFTGIVYIRITTIASVAVFIAFIEVCIFKINVKRMPQLTVLVYFMHVFVPFVLLFCCYIINLY